jgi:ABC-type nitrate/sulfonate/bicarbonate transport system substrate-binding protein
MVEANDLLATMTMTIISRNLAMLAAVALVLLALIAGWGWWRAQSENGAIRVAISPYQDIAMLVNYKKLGLEQRYGVAIETVTMNWEDIPPAIASAGRTIDVGFGSYVEYLTKYENLNAGSSDPVLFVYPLYVFRGGAFVSFNPAVPALSGDRIKDTKAISEFLKFRIGAQRNSIYDMMLFYLARLGNVPREQLRIIDTPLDQGFLAAQQGSLDIAEAGLTQLTEAVRGGGRSVLNMDDLGFADITGFIVRKSVYEKRKNEIQKLIRVWFDCVDYVFSHIDENSKTSLDYLNRTASTRYTLEEYKKALLQEYFPRTIEEANKELVSTSGKFAYRKIGETVISFLIENGVVRSKPPLPTFTDP